MAAVHGDNRAPSPCSARRQRRTIRSSCCSPRATYPSPNQFRDPQFCSLSLHVFSANFKMSSQHDDTKYDDTQYTEARLVPIHEGAGGQTGSSSSEVSGGSAKCRTCGGLTSPATCSIYKCKYPESVAESTRT